MRRLNLPAILLTFCFGTSLAFGASGEKLYNSQCAHCHGKSGEGSNKYAKPLIGDRSIPQLAEQIRKTMPKEEPETLSKEDAAAIASYVFDSFYSPAARERNKPVQTELARLTVPQYRNAVADIIEYFRGSSTWRDKKLGLKGEYFKDRNHGKRVIERVDPMVQFDFGTNAPAEKDFDSKEFAIRWTGSVYVPETGEYTFIVKSDQSVRLFVNDGRNAIADGYVRSGTDNEYKGSLFLLGGRNYPIRLDFSKALQGVKDKNPKPIPAFVRLQWQVPGGTVETIPERHLSIRRCPETYIVATKFPPDDRSYGWERGTTVSKAWDQSTTDAALDAAEFVSLRINELASTNDQDAKRVEKIKSFLKTFVKLAFRRPATSEIEAIFVNKQLDGNPDTQLAVKRAILMILKSPRFLYREPAMGADAFDVASRMAFSLWDSIPSMEMLDLASNGKFKSQADLKKFIAEKMMEDARTRARLLGFMHHWLKTDHGRDAVKDVKRFPGFDSAIVGDLRTSLDLTLEEIIWSPKSDFRQLFLGKETFLNGRLAKYYGHDLPAESGFKKVAFEPDRRTGVLTHPYLLATLAYSSETSPIHRGVFLAKGILGTGLKPPQEAFTPLSADSLPNSTTRERVELQTKGANCQSCHQVINHLGFTLENFDAVGKFRAKDNNKDVDLHGNYLTRAGDVITFNGSLELSRFLVDSPDVHSAFVDQMFHHLVQQSIRAFGANRSNELRESFAKGGFNIRDLAVEIVAGIAIPNLQSSKSK